MEINTMTSTENLFFKVSVAEAQLNEYYKEDNLFKALNILKEILSGDIEKNSRNILNTILSKLIECYIKSNNKIRNAVNHLVSQYSAKFSEIFINKDITNNIQAVVTCSDCIARSYALELISHLPTLLDKRLELLHTVYDLFINEKSLYDEKMTILGVFDSVLRTGINCVYVRDLLMSNFQKMMRVNIKCFCNQSFYKSCEKCHNLKLKLISVIEKNFADAYFKQEYLLTVRDYFISYFHSEYFRISVRIVHLMKKFDLNYVVESMLSTFSNISTDSTTITEMKLCYILLYYFNLFPIHSKEKCIAILQKNSENILTFFESNLKSCQNLLLLFAFSLFTSDLIITYEVLQTDPLTKLVKVLALGIEINTVYDYNLQKLLDGIVKEVKIDELEVDHKDLKFFHNSENIKNLISIVKGLHHLSSYKNLENLLTSFLNKIVKAFDTKLDYIKYTYFLDKLSHEIKDNESFTQILTPFIGLMLNCTKDGYITKYINYSKTKLCDKYNFSRKINILTLQNDIGSTYSKIKKNFIANALIEAQSDCDKIMLHFNDDSVTEYFNKMFILKMNLKEIDINPEIEERLSEHVNLQTRLLARDRKEGFTLSKFSKDFISLYSKLISTFFQIKKRINYRMDDENIKVIQEVVDSIINSPMVCLVTLENKLNLIIDIKTKLLTKKTIAKHKEFLISNINNLIDLYSKFLLIINVPLYIAITSTITKSITDNMFLIKTKLCVANYETYFNKIYSVYVSVSINYKQIKDIHLVFSNQKKAANIRNESVFFYTKTKPDVMNEVVLTFSFSFVYDDFFKINFFEYTAEHII